MAKYCKNSTFVIIEMIIILKNNRVKNIYFEYKVILIFIIKEMTTWIKEKTNATIIKIPADKSIVLFCENAFINISITLDKNINIDKPCKILINFFMCILYQNFYKKQ